MISHILKEMRRGNLYWHIKQFPFSTFFHSAIPPDSLCNNNAERNTKQKRITTKWLRTKVILIEYKAHVGNVYNILLVVGVNAILSRRYILVSNLSTSIAYSFCALGVNVADDGCITQYNISVSFFLLNIYGTRKAANTESYFKKKSKSINKTI